LWKNNNNITTTNSKNNNNNNSQQRKNILEFRCTGSMSVLQGCLGGQVGHLPPNQTHCRGENQQHGEAKHNHTPIHKHMANLSDEAGCVQQKTSNQHEREKERERERKRERERERESQTETHIRYRGAE
jgi:hypothetical protein